MGSDLRYPIPAGTHRVEMEIKRSRFITTLAYAGTVEEARAFIERVRGAFPDASHNCWAYLVGPPGTTGAVGMSDDGEPHGTAGRPMLTVLTYGGVGDVAAVVTRYFGGTKLGKGGLVRAYSGGVQEALRTMPRTERVVYARLAVVLEYAGVERFRRMLPEYEVVVEDEAFGADVTFRVKVPEERAAAFRAAVTELTRGRVMIEAVQEEE